ncbi:hypothetical protein ACWDR0_24875 [Streptomyces sp. NPDC003691]
MSMPEGWEWLEEVPGEWNPPGEIQDPSNSVGVNLAIQILSCDAVGLNIRVLVGRFIAEQSNFTIWFLREVKGSRRDLREVAIISRTPSVQTRLVFEAWSVFRGALTEAGSVEELLPKVVAGRDGLSRALVEAIDKLVAAREF